MSKSSHASLSAVVTPIVAHQAATQRTERHGERQHICVVQQLGRERHPRRDTQTLSRRLVGTHKRGATGGANCALYRTQRPQ